MRASPLALFDRDQWALFERLGAIQNSFRTASHWIEPDGSQWLGLQLTNWWIAVSSLGPGRVFDPACGDVLAAALPAVAAAPEPQRLENLHRVAAEVRLGGHAFRLLVAIHTMVVTRRISSLKPAECTLADVLWGPAECWPRHWRVAMLGLLKGLTWLHVAKVDDAGGRPRFGHGTALLNHVGFLDGDPELDVCDEHCERRLGARHHHVLIDVGPALLGVLEQFGRADAEGVRIYEFPWAAKGKEAMSLRKLGRRGLLVSRYLPALLGPPSRCQQLNPNQHRILQALVRETTRGPRVRGQPAEAAIIGDTLVPAYNNRLTVPCPSLEAGARYIAFNGNGVRKGAGYKLTSVGGWLAKAGVPTNQLNEFLLDWADLASKLGLVVVGVGRTGWPGLHELLQLAEADRSAVGKYLVRVYTRDDYLGRWNAFFGWSAAVAPASITPALVAAGLRLLLRERQVPQAGVAAGLKLDPAYLTKMLHGRKHLSAERAQQIREFVLATGAVRAMAAAMPTKTMNPVGMLETALAYRNVLGWSVIPQVSATKKAVVKWKPYQTRLATLQEVKSARWWGGHQKHGIALITGPLSRVLVIDVDGSEAEVVLRQRLGGDPVAPKVLSGSGDPHRYHYYFLHPPFATKAKATPWHPKLEFRGANGLVVVPPSLHNSGNTYRWARGQSIWELPLPPLPETILAALQPLDPPPEVQPPNYPPTSGTFSAATRAFLDGKLAEGPGWNSALFAAACELSARGIPKDHAIPQLLQGARPWNNAEREAALKTIESAYSCPRNLGGH